MPFSSQNVYVTEEVRLNLPRDKPVAVQQWQGLIAVNYAARKAGIKRMTTVDEAKRLCPELILVHVPTYGPDDHEPQYYPSPSRATHKVSLDPYRNASKSIFKIFHKYCTTIQKIGLDEGFLDITDIVNDRIRAKYVPHNLDRMDGLECGIDLDWEELGIAVGKGGDDVEKSTTWRDLQLAVGAELAQQIRKEIRDTLNYTCSAGKHIVKGRKKEAPRLKLL
ncbi:hypothetical protein BX666DRAFT_1851230 [Dichotomocladium elegans]|nr:hypothetical protein BX666DRAFT_1851230 [Dichotomocladium elegans]